MVGFSHANAISLQTIMNMEDSHPAQVDLSLITPELKPFRGSPSTTFQSAHGALHGTTAPETATS
jgi:hypothetical protein